MIDFKGKNTLLRPAAEPRRRGNTLPLANGPVSHDETMAYNEAVTTDRIFERD